VKSAQVTVEFMDGSKETARSVMRDYLAFETTGKRQKPPWGTISESPTRFESFVAWSALRREGRIDEPYEGFLDRVVQIDFEFDEDIVPTSEVTGAD
jgi:hypothetical protein